MGDFALRGEFLSQRWERNQRIAGGRLRMGTDVPIFALPPVPHYGGRVPVEFCRISGAQNLSGFLQFRPAHWGLALQKLQSLRFRFRAWLCRAGDSWSMIGGPASVRPLRKRRDASRFAVGAAHRAARRFLPHNLSPAATKALPTRGVPDTRFAPSQRQRKTREKQSAEPPAPLR